MYLSPFMLYYILTKSCTRGTWLDKNGAPKSASMLQQDDAILKKLALSDFASIRNFTDLETRLIAKAKQVDAQEGTRRYEEFAASKSKVIIPGIFIFYIVFT